ncbi:MAG TPA: hypothetical protein VFM18_23380 [Methanosarcina sp.]|nr:hypothetical protein [Methanosarcina sp.]
MMPTEGSSILSLYERMGRSYDESAKSISIELHSRIKEAQSNPAVAIILTTEDLKTISPGSPPDANMNFNGVKVLVVNGLKKSLILYSDSTTKPITE